MRPADESQPRDHVDSARLLRAENRAPLLESLHQVLKIRQSLRGGWGFNTKQDALEPTCLAILTLRHQTGVHVEKALNRIAQLQHQDGSWPVFDGAGREGAWTTALAVLSLLSFGSKGGSLQRAIGWLLSQRGREADWFWRWKFRTVDTDVRFDPAKYGWNWIPGTISWVIPTAFSLIALRRARNLNATAKLDERVKLGAAMIFDRMCPGGGWNAGNGEAFGIPYAPYIDATAIALSRFARMKRNPAFIVRCRGW